MTIREAQAEGTGVLDRARVEAPSLDASLLLAFATGTDRVRLLASFSDRISADGLSRYRELVARRADGVCVAHLVGRKEFRGLDFMVTPDVLVPRPDTETLVESALDWIDQRASDAAGRMIRAIDVCTGSGCVAVSVKTERPDTAVAASDVSEAALEVARRNAERLLAPPRSGGDPIDFHLGDLLAPAPGPFDLIVSNPPYIPSAVVDTLSAEVRKEPRLALDGGRDGLDLIRRLVRESFLKLNPHGRLLIEAGYDQSAEVARIMRGAGFTGIGTYRDLAGIERVTGGTRP